MKRNSIVKMLAVASIISIYSCSSESDKYLEEEAIAALDATTETIGNMTSCSLRITNESTEMVDGQPVSHLRQSDIYLRESDKLHIYTTYDDVRKGFWYNGSELAVFRFDENIYDVTPAPATTIAMIDSLHRTFKIDFPAADIFYPTLTDDIIANFDSVFYLGTQDVYGTLCKTVYATNSNLKVTLFIDDATNLPVQLDIYGHGEREGESYVSYYQDWQIDPKLGDEIFEFAPPSNSEKGEIFKKD